MALVTPHEDAIDKALVNALHAFSNKAGKSKDDRNLGTERSYQHLSTPSMGISLVPEQTLEAANLNVPPQSSNAIADEGLCSDPRYTGHGHFSLIDARSTYEISNKTRRPSYRYATLIAMAILQANDRCLLLAQICQWISIHFPFYNLADSGWQNSIRHNLSLNKNFIKIERPSHNTGKGHYWGVKPGQEHQLIYEIDADRSAKPIGNLGRRRARITCPSVKRGQLAAPTTTHSAGELYSNDNTMKAYPQRAENWTRVTVENSGWFPERKLSYSSTIPLTLAPPLFSQPRREIETSPLPKECHKDHIERALNLEPDEITEVCDYTPPDDTPVTHVYLPHVMRYTGAKRRRFEAHRAESEIFRIRRARMKRLRSMSRTQDPDGSCP